MVMIRVNVHEVKAKLSEYLDRAARGERVVICRHNTPVAELRPVGDARTEPRPIGPLAGRPTFELADRFFEPISEDELAAWEGIAPGEVVYEQRPPDRAASRVSEPAPARPRTARRSRTGKART